jgi:hypothetical protein
MLSSAFCFAQKTDEHYMPAQYTNEHCRVSFNKVFIGDTRDVKKVEEFLKRSISNLSPKNVSVELKYTTESPVGIHYSFFQTFYGTEIYQSEIKVNCDKQGNVISIFDNSYDTKNFYGLTFTISFNPWNVSEDEDIIVLNPNTQKVEFGTREIVKDKNGIYGLEEIYLPESGYTFTHDLNSYLAPPDSLVTGYVYFPDPLTSAQAIYGGFYVDSDDADNAALNNQRVQVQFNANFDGTNFSLSNSYINMTDFDGPNVSPPVVTSPVFDFTRTQDSFEDVNVFYHLNVMRDYVHDLGFDAADYPVDVDAHALSNQDNSLFAPSYNPKRLYFGEGGVDDAEDADVIVHEYSHFLSYNAAPGTNVGGQRQALDEGFGDYMAASYSRSISNYNWTSVYSWDGHNEFWNGRVVNVNRVYPQDLQGSIYRNGEMWASALMSLWEEIGRGATDSLILQAHYSYSSNMNMDDAGYLMLQADTLLNNGAYYCPIYRNMYNRGFLPYYANNPCALSIANESIEGLGFWQNPAAFTITYEGDRNLSFEIADATGRIVESKTDITHNNFTHRAPNLANGLYFIVVAEGNARKAFKWIKQD